MRKNRIVLTAALLMSLCGVTSAQDRGFRISDRVESGRRDDSDCQR